MGSALCCLNCLAGYNNIIDQIRDSVHNYKCSLLGQQYFYLNGG